MTGKEIYRAMGGIDPRLILDAAPAQSRRNNAKHFWVKWGALAACVCIAIFGVFYLSIAFTPSQATDIYREGIHMEIENFDDLPAEYDGTLLVNSLPLSENAEIDFYYKEGGVATNIDDWYCLLIFDHHNDCRLLMHCMFGDTTVEDWKVSMVFTKDATQTVTIHGVDVQIARLELSLQYDYWYYAIFEYDDVVYDIRVQSNDPDRIFEILNTMLEAQ